jgi:uncharacterized protein (TIGR00725 family)
MNQKRFTIAVVGAEDAPQEILHKAKHIGSELAKAGAVVATGAVGGFGMWAAMGANEASGVTIGFSPASSKEEHENHFRQPSDYLNTVVYTGFGYLGRDLLLARSVDAVVIGLGGKDSAHELSLAHELKKPVFVLHNHNEQELQDLLGELYQTARLHSEPQELLMELQSIK